MCRKEELLCYFRHFFHIEIGLSSSAYQIKLNKMKVKTCYVLQYTIFINNVKDYKNILSFFIQITLI